MISCSRTSREASSSGGTGGAFRSCPAQNERPRPARTTAAAGRSRIVRSASTRPSMSAPLTALSAAGRFSQITPISPTHSTSTARCPVPLTLAASQLPNRSIDRSTVSSGFSRRQGVALPSLAANGPADGCRTRRNGSTRPAAGSSSSAIRGVIANRCRVAARTANTLDSTSGNTGFRLAASDSRPGVVESGQRCS